MTDQERLRTAAWGLTMVNAGLGLALWAAVLGVLGIRWNLLAILSLGAAFLHVLGLVYCGQSPPEAKASVAAWVAAVFHGAFFACILYGLMLTDEHSFAPSFLLLAAAGTLATLVYLILMILYCENRIIEKNRTRLAWWIAVATFITSFMVWLVLPFVELEERFLQMMVGGWWAISIGAYSNAVLLTRRFMRRVAVELET